MQFVRQVTKIIIIKSVVLDKKWQKKAREPGAFTGCCIVRGINTGNDLLCRGHSPER